MQRQESEIGEEVNNATPRVSMQFLHERVRIYSTNGQSYAVGLKKRINQNVATATIADAGMVSTQAHIMRVATRQRTAGSLYDGRAHWVELHILAGRPHISRALQRFHCGHNGIGYMLQSVVGIQH